MHILKWRKLSYELARPFFLPSGCVADRNRSPWRKGSTEEVPGTMMVTTSAMTNDGVAGEQQLATRYADDGGFDDAGEGDWRSAGSFGQGLSVSRDTAREISAAWNTVVKRHSERRSTSTTSSCSRRMTSRPSGKQ